MGVLMKKSFITNFFICGLVGWCFECFFTGLGALKHNDRKLVCKTSVWMFPIYGLAAFISPIHHAISGKNTAMRGLIYTMCIFITEFITGEILKKYKACPWDYKKAKYNVDGVIRLDYAPVWFLLGLLYEKVVSANEK
jgi:uncharacterized membrane protein